MSTLEKLRYMARQYTSGQMARGGSQSKHYLDEAADEIEALREKVAELERFHDLDMKQIDYLLVERTNEKHKVKVLTDAIECLIPQLGDIVDIRLAKEALATPSSTDALKEHDAQLVERAKTYWNSADPQRDHDIGDYIMKGRS